MRFGLDKIWRWVEDALLAPPAVASATLPETTPVLWLLGKTGAGKTAIVAALTGDARAEIGNGFQSCTREARLYETPFLRFLDTRGLEEPGYSPAEDLAWCEGQAQMLLVVAQANDPAQDAVLRVVREARRRHPDWPVVVAQTALHRLYGPGESHTDPLPENVQRALAHQQRLFAGLDARFVPLDFTEEGDGHSPRLFGLQALEDALAATLPEAMAALHAARADTGDDARRARARQSIYAYAGLSLGAGAVPIPWAGAAGLASLQAAMLRALARHYGVAWTRPLFARFAGCLGGGTLGWFALRFGVTEALKLIPGIGTLAGGAANAAFAAAFTAGTGEAALVFLRDARRGEATPAAEIRAAYAEGFRAWRASRT